MDDEILIGKLNKYLGYDLMEKMEENRLNVVKKKQDIVNCIILSLSENLLSHSNIFNKKIFLKNESFFLDIYFSNSNLNLNEKISREININNQLIISLLSSISNLSINDRIWFYEKINNFKISSSKILIGLDIDFLTNYNNSEIKNQLTYIGVLFLEIIERSRREYASNGLISPHLNEGYKFLESILEQLNELKLLNYFDKPVNPSKEISYFNHIDKEMANVIEKFIDCIVLFYSNIYYSNVTNKKVDLKSFFNSNKSLFGEQITLEDYSNIKSYKWISKNPKSLSSFYSAITRENLFEGSVSFEDFKICFQDIDITQIKSTIRLKLNISEVLFMVLILMQKKLIFDEQEWDYKRIKYIFNLNSSTHNIKSMNGKIDKRIQYKETDKLTIKRKKILKIIESVV